MQIDLLIFHGAPEPLDKHVVALGRLAIHADYDTGFLQRAVKAALVN